MNYWRRLIISLLFIFSTTIFAVPQQLDKVLAIVNNSIVLQSDLDNMLNVVRINARNAGQQIPNENELRHKILEHLIIDTIIMQVAEKMQIQISNKEINMTISNIAAQNGLTISQLQKELAINGISIKNYISDIRKRMMIAEVQNNEVRRRIVVLPQEVESLATQLNYKSSENTNVNLSYILIPLQKNPTYEQNQLALATVNKILKQLKQGADFGKLALIYSADSSALKSGQIGWSKIEELPTVFAQQIQHAKKGSIIEPIRSSVGFHILKLNDIKSGNIPISVTEMKIRHILIKQSPIMNNNQVYAKIEQIAQKIEMGQISFADAAKKYSQDSNSASRGGELDWNMHNVYGPAFHNSLMSLSKDKVSQPIHSSFGWHLIQLEDTREINKINEVSRKDYAYRLLFNREFNKEAQIWMQELRGSAYVKILNDNDTK